MVIYLLVVFVGGALLAPWLYVLTNGLAAHWHGLAKLASNPFPRFVSRALLGTAFLGTWPLLRFCKMTSWRDLGFNVRSRPLSGISVGFLLGFGSLAGVTLLAICLGGRSFNAVPSGHALAHAVFNAGLSAMIVALLEEFLFRGALFGILRKGMAWPKALVVSSAIYALAHFLQKTGWNQPVTWSSGLELLPRMFDSGPPLMPAVFTLFTAGAILALAYQRTGALFFSMGLHAGWIFWLKSYGFLTIKAPGSNSFVWGTDKLIDGWLAFPILVCVLWIVSRMETAEGQAA